MKVNVDDAKRLRIRDATLGVEFSQSGRDPSLGMPCLLVQSTTIKSYPTSAQSYFGCSPLTVLGTETEGDEGAITVEPATFFALNVGSVVPPVGTNLLATFVGNRWVFRYDG